MDKNDIINYVMETPGNSNPAVLGSMLDSYSGGGGSGGAWIEEFTWWTNPENPNYDIRAISTRSAEEILTAFRSGTQVIFHIPFKESFFVGGYYTLGSVSDGRMERRNKETDEWEYKEAPFGVLTFSDSQLSYNSPDDIAAGWSMWNADSISLFNQVEILDNGKLALSLYID